MKGVAITPAASPPPSGAPSRARRYLRTFAGAVLGLTITGIAISAWIVDRIWRQLPSVDHLSIYRPAMPLRIYLRAGVLLAEYGTERHKFVPIEQIPPRERHALIDDDYAYAEYPGGKCVDAPPSYIHLAFAFDGARN